jgi:mono/diheme cytochrome c family protein
MTGMPAWEFRLTEEALWDVVAFVMASSRWSPADYARRAAVLPASRPPEPPVGPADTARGKVALQQYACGTCHEIPGIVGADKPVGPPLERIGSRGMLAGILPNTTENMVRWLRDPKGVSPESAMPALGVTERDARDIAAYLSTLR